MLPTQSSHIFVHKMHVQLPITASALQLIIQVQKQLRPTYVNALLWSTPNKSIVFHFICMSLKLYREGGQKETGRGPGATAAPVCWWATLSWNVPLAPKWSIRHCRYKVFRINIPFILICTCWCRILCRRWPTHMEQMLRTNRAALFLRECKHTCK